MAQGNTPVQQANMQLLCECIRAGNVKEVKRLATNSNVNKQHDRKTPLMHAAFSEKASEICKVLLQLRKIRVDQADILGSTAMHHAASNGQTELVRLLHKKNKKLVNNKDQAGFTPLMVAAAFDKVETIAALLECGASWQERNNMGQTAVDVARYHKSRSAYHLLYAKQQLQLLSELAKQEQPKKERAAKPHYALEIESGLMQMLREDKNDEHMKLKRSFRTSLMLAAKEKNNAGINTVAALLDCGADAKEKDAFGCTALHYAAVNNNDKVMEKLLPKSDINSQCQLGLTPLMLAVSSGKEAAVKFLIDNKADTTLKDCKNLTAMDFANVLGRKDICEMLDRAEREAKRLARAAAKADAVRRAE